MSSDKGIKQPALGICGTVISVLLALTFSTRFAPEIFGSWVAQLIMSAIPLQIVIGLVWGGNYPTFLSRLGQPIKGLAILALMAVAAAVVTPSTLAAVGGLQTPPSPFVIMFTILSICTTFWLVVVFQCWPVKALTDHPAAVGFGILALSYALNWMIFADGFDFGAMAGAPFYVAALDPHGLFGAWDILSFVVTSVAVIMWFVMLDFWPTVSLVDVVPSVGRQPLFGLVSAALVLAITGAIWTLCVKALHMDVVDFMVRVPVSGLFGEFILLVMMQTAPFEGLRQPGKGLSLLAVTALLAVVTYRLYVVVAQASVGPLPSGAPSYGLDLWVATAMLSVTFPVFVAYGEGFGFWPLTRSAPGSADAVAEAGANN